MNTQQPVAQDDAARNCSQSSAQLKAALIPEPNMKFAF
jgi:hypothetical protein